MGASSSWAVIIVTRDRFYELRKILPNWLEQDLPILLLTEPGQVKGHKELVEGLGAQKEIIVGGHPKRNKGVGYARMRAVETAQAFGIEAFIMSDDDMRITRGNVRKLLKFVADEKAIICGGWMSNYGLWVPDGNKIKNETNLVIPCGGARDRVFAVNTKLAIRAGNFDPQLKTLDTQEMNRRGMAAGHLWYIHTGCHIAMTNKPHDPGGIQAMYKTEEERAAQNKRDHQIVYKRWGPKYISHPSKRMATKWLVMATDFIGPRAAAALKAAKPYPEARVASAIRMFRR